MLVGHYSAAFVAKAAAPRIPLWALFLAVQLVDVFWGVFIFTGVETAHLDASLPSNPLALDHMPYTHGLAASLAWAAAAGGLAAWLGRSWDRPWRVGLAVFACVLSHWFLDFLVHRQDLTLFDPSQRYGLALWDRPLLAYLLEIALLGASVALFTITVRPPRARAMLVLVGVAVAVQTSAFFTPPPPDIAVVAASALFTFLALAGAVYWLHDRPAARRSAR